MKQFKELSWQVEEKVYRESDFVSYSLLSIFAKEGIRGVLEGKKLDTDYLRFGSLVDIIITAPDEILKKYFILDNFKLSEGVVTAVDELFNAYGGSFNTLNDIDSDKILYICNSVEYQTNWREETRINKIKELGSGYYATLQESKGKQIVSSEDMKDAHESVLTLKTNPFTAKYFDDYAYENHIEVYNQLKFKYDDTSWKVKCMVDRIIVDHKEKTIQPIDIKTTGEKEEYFASSFIKWRYDIQASLYYFILREIIEEDEYFKDFSVLPFKFICINRYYKTPLIWTAPLWILTGLNFKTEYGTEIKGWKILIDELLWHKEKEVYTYSKEAYINNGELQLDKFKSI